MDDQVFMLDFSGENAPELVPVTLESEGTYPFNPRSGPPVFHPPAPEAEPGQGAMTKTHPDGTRKAWSPEACREDRRWITNGLYDKSPEPNLICGCGSEDFKVCWWDYPYTGGYLRLVCSACGKAALMMDDFS